MITIFSFSRNASVDNRRYYRKGLGWSYQVSVDTVVYYSTE